MSKLFWILMGLWLTASGLVWAERGVLVVRDSAGQEVGLYEQSHALLVGVSDYGNGWPRLPGVADDLTAVEQALKRQGFVVRLVKDPPDKDALETAFEDFILDHGLAPNNRLLFYFAGHGHTRKPTWAGEDPERWTGYIVARDAPPPERDLQGFLRNAVSMKRFEELAEQIQAKHALFLFDSCFSGSVFALSRARPRSIGYKTARPVRQFITSGGADETVPDKSEFRRQLEAALAGEADGNGDRYVTGAELGEFLQDRVINYTRGAQHPQYGKIRNPRLDKGDFVFVLGAEEPAPPPPVARGHLQVSVNVPAQVHIGGERAGEAAPGRPLNLRNLPVGPLELRVQARGYLAETQSARIQRDRWTQLSVRLVPEPPTAVQAPPSKPAADPQASKATLTLTPAQRRQVQSALNALGWNAGPADGVFGPRTRDALRDYQRSVGVTATGYLTAEQWAGLAAKTGEGATSRPPVETGSTWTEPVTGMELVWVPEGCFEMGSEDGDSDERPVHRVCLQGFWLGRHEVTQGQWKRVMGDNPSRFKKGDAYPVEQVSWNSAQAFIAKLKGKGQGGFRLPSEAQWEYACRSGGRAETYCGGEDADPLAWHEGNSGGTTHPVGRKQANGLGLHDMSGNVAEWVQDCWRESYQGAPGDGSARERGKCARRVIRGGSWSYGPRYVRAADRFWYSPENRLNDVGFRLARTP